VLQGTGFEGLETFWHIVGRYVYYAMELLIIIGLLASLMKRRMSFFDDEYNFLAFLNVFLIVACVVVPNFADTFNMTRFYHVSLFFLAPFCISGGIALLRLLSRKRVKDSCLRSIVVLMVILPFFLFQTGFVYEVTGEASFSLPLSGYRFSRVQLHFKRGVVGEAEVYGAIWLSRFRDLDMRVYADITSGRVFVAGGVQNAVLLSFDSAVTTGLVNGSYVYLREYNVYNGIIFRWYGLESSFNVTQIVPSLNMTNMIYSSGSCEIYRIPPIASV